MRILLHIIFLPLIVLIVIENLIVRLFTLSKSASKKIRRFSITTLIRIKKTQRALLSSFRKGLVKKLHAIRKHVAFLRTVVRKKRKKRTDGFSFPIRSKIKYFFLGSLFSLLFIFLPLVVIIFLQD